MKLKIYNERMLELINWAKGKGIVTTEKEFMERIGFPAERAEEIVSGISFKKNHIEAAAKFTGVSVRWLIGVSTRMFKVITSKK